MLELDVRKAVLYPPETFVQARPLDIRAGENPVFDYRGFGPYVIWLEGVSHARYDGMESIIYVDGVEMARIDHGAVGGLEVDENCRWPAVRSLSLRVVSTVAAAGYQTRHRISAARPTIYAKMWLGMPLTQGEAALAGKHDLRTRLAVKHYPRPDYWAGVEKVFTLAKTFAAEGTLWMIRPPAGYKAVLMDISALRPTGPGTARITVSRDHQPYPVMELDPWCLKSLDAPPLPMRVVALDYLLIEAGEVRGRQGARITYGLGRITIQEKLMWDMPLTGEEEAMADRYGIRELVEVG